MGKMSGKHWTVVICAVILIVLQLLLMLPTTLVGRETREELHLRECSKNLERISKLCQKYASEHNGEFPSDGIQKRSIAEQFLDGKYLTRETAVLLNCPATKPRPMRSSYHFIPGVKLGMSPRMPCVIEKITNHDREIGVIYVDGSTAMLKHEAQDYSSLLPFFQDITEQEKQQLQIHLKRLDIP